MHRESVDMRPLAGKSAFLRLVDQSSAPWGHLNFDDFIFHPDAPVFPSSARSRQEESPVLWHLRPNPGPPSSVPNPAALLELAGTDLGTTEWITVGQQRINEFADATGDHQWIHVDVERATAESPFGGPIAHGYLTLSLVNLFLPDLVTVEEFSMGVNVGLERVRFTSPVPSGARIRGRGEVVSVTEEKGGVQAVVRVTVEIEGADRPACVADTISRFFP